MRRVKPINIISWYEKCREEINALPARLPTMTIEEQLQHIRQQYVILAHIDSVFNGKAYFLGYPRKLVERSQNADPVTSE